MGIPILQVRKLGWERGGDLPQVTGLGSQGWTFSKAQTASISPGHILIGVWGEGRTRQRGCR